MRYSRYNTEIQVALLRTQIYRKDLANLLGLGAIEFSHLLNDKELPVEAQKMMIDLIMAIPKEDELTIDDLINYKNLLAYVRKWRITYRDDVDARIISFAQNVEKKCETEQRENFEALNEIFNI